MNERDVGQNSYSLKFASASRSGDLPRKLVSATAGAAMTMAFPTSTEFVRRERLVGAVILDVAGPGCQELLVFMAQSPGGPAFS
jgi:hypothetical protein